MRLYDCLATNMSLLSELGQVAPGLLEMRVSAGQTERDTALARAVSGIPGRPGRPKSRLVGTSAALGRHPQVAPRHCHHSPTPGDGAPEIPQTVLQPVSRSTGAALRRPLSCCAALGVIKTVGQLTAPLCPGGASENSPAFQRRVSEPKARSVPKGRLRATSILSRPFGTRVSVLASPALKHRAYCQMSLRDKTPAAHARRF
jgi:hypothetical protein